MLTCKESASCSRRMAISRHIWELCATHNQLNGVSKGSIQQPAQRLAQLERDLLGRKGQDGSKRDDGKEVDGEDGGRAPAEAAGDDANGDHDEQEVDIV